MANVSVHKRVNAPLEKVFATWNDEFADIYKFNPNLSHSRLLDNSPSASGVGSLRQCDLADGKNWIRERVIELKHNRQLVVDIFEGTMPLRSAVATFDFRAVNPHQTDVTVTMDFEPKMGVIGKLMIPMMKKQFAPMLQGLLNGNANYAESGVLVNKAVAAA